MFFSPSHRLRSTKWFRNASSAPAAGAENNRENIWIRYTSRTPFEPLQCAADHRNVVPEDICSLVWRFLPRRASFFGSLIALSVSALALACCFLPTYGGSHDNAVYALTNSRGLGTLSDDMEYKYRMNETRESPGQNDIPSQNDFPGHSPTPFVLRHKHITLTD